MKISSPTLHYRLDCSPPLLAESWGAAQIIKKRYRKIPSRIQCAQRTEIWLPQGFYLRFTRVPAELLIEYSFRGTLLIYSLTHNSELPVLVHIQLHEDEAKVSEMKADASDPSLVAYHIKRSSVPAAEDDLLTTAQAAEYLGVAEATLRNWNYLRKINFIKVGRAVRYSKSALDEFMKKK